MNKIKISFHQLLSKTNAQSLAPVYCTISLNSNSKPVKLSTNIWLRENEWDKKQKRVKSKHIRSTALNLQLSNVEQKVLSLYDDLKRTQDYPSLETIKLLFRNKAQTKNTLLTLYDAFIINIEKRKGIDYALGTIRHYKCNRHRIEQFLKQIYSCTDIEIAKLNLEFISGFETFLSTSFGNGVNRIYKQTQKLKRVIGYGLKNEWFTNDPFSIMKERLSLRIDNFSRMLN